MALNPDLDGGQHGNVGNFALSSLLGERRNGLAVTQASNTPQALICSPWNSLIFTHVHTNIIIQDRKGTCLFYLLFILLYSLILIPGIYTPFLTVSHFFSPMVFAVQGFQYSHFLILSILHFMRKPGQDPEMACMSSEQPVTVQKFVSQVTRKHYLHSLQSISSLLLGNRVFVDPFQLWQKT